MQPSTVTRSPTRRSGREPSVWTIRPENSWPSVTGTETPVIGFGRWGRMYSGPRYSLTSLAQMDAQSTATIDQPAEGLGSSTSSRRTSRCPWNRSAFIVPFLHWLRMTDGNSARAAPGASAARRPGGWNAAGEDRRSSTSAPGPGAQDHRGDDDPAPEHQLLGNAETEDDQPVVDGS